MYTNLMARKTSPEKINAICDLVAMGYTEGEIAKKARVNYQTVDRIKIEFATKIEDIKKAIIVKTADTAADKLSALAVDMLEGSKKALDLILARIAEASPAQAAVILGILQDKYNLIIGNPTANVHVQFQSRNEMISYIKSGGPQRLLIKPEPDKIEIEDAKGKLKREKQ